MREYTSKPPEPADDDDEADEPYNALAGISFQLDGVEFRCQGRASILDTSELAAAAVAAVDSAEPEGLAIISDFLKTSLGMREYRRFRRHQRMHDTPDETVLDIIGGISDELEAGVEDVTGRPTRQPSASTRGQPAPGGRASSVIGLKGGDVTLVDSGAGQEEDPALAEERANQLTAKRDAQAAKRRPQRQNAQAKVMRLG
jgi:hypothetical protein